MTILVSKSQRPAFKNAEQGVLWAGISYASVLAPHPAIPAIPARPAVPASGGNAAIPATPAVPAVPAVPGNPALLKFFAVTTDNAKVILTMRLPLESLATALENLNFLKSIKSISALTPNSINYPIPGSYTLEDEPDWVAGSLEKFLGWCASKCDCKTVLVPDQTSIDITVTLPNESIAPEGITLAAIATPSSSGTGSSTPAPHPDAPAGIDAETHSWIIPLPADAPGALDFMLLALNAYTSGYDKVNFYAHGVSGDFAFLGNGTNVSTTYQGSKKLRSDPPDNVGTIIPISALNFAGRTFITFQDEEIFSLTLAFSTASKYYQLALANLAFTPNVANPYLSIQVKLKPQEVLSA